MSSVITFSSSKTESFRTAEVGLWWPPSRVREGDVTLVR